MANLISAVVAIAAGVGGIVVLYWLLNKIVEQLPAKWEERLKPYVFVGPALALLGVFLVWPAIRTVVLSFFGPDAEQFVGLDNYTNLGTNPDLRESIFNTVLWVLIVPALAVIVGLVVAVLSDRLKPTSEKVTKSVIFMPMAVAMVAATTTFMLIYAWRPEGAGQIGILNAIWTSFGGDPQTWLRISTARVNSILLMLILVWMWAGFGMVLLSAAIKNVPQDTLEAGRVDGASEIQIFFRVVVPQIATTIMVVFTTITLVVLKTFDVVWVATGGQFGTEILPVTFIREFITFRNQGQAAAVIVAIMVATAPVMAYNVKRYREQEAR